MKPWRCAHPRTPENTRGRGECRECYLDYQRRWRESVKGTLYMMAWRRANT